MTAVVSRNTIKLAGGASGSTGYYTGYTIVLTHINPTTKKKVVQKHKIKAYDGNSKIATIEGMWEIGFHPQAGDTYDIIPPYPDARVSINPAMQALDYITSDRYGRGLNPTEDLVLDSWLESGRTCNTRSDITVEVVGVSGISIEAIYRYPASGNILWQGRVAEVSDNFVRFTDVIGKLTNKWFDWKTYPAGAAIYHEGALYTATGGTIAAIPGTGISSSTGLTLTKVSGGGPGTLLTKADGNPIRAIKNGVLTSGYSLYDSDGVDYWRHIGWNSHEQREVTRHQTNLTLDTSVPLFDNMNSILGHFGGILRYTGDKYSLEVEDIEPQISNAEEEPRNITADHILGKIKLSDDGIKSAYNSLVVSYSDPANKFEGRNISFFNSDYLKADRNVPKKGNVTIPGITNYYNARLLADKYLAKSRFGLTINMTLAPRGALLVAGRVIQVNYPRYNWVNKKFRIENLRHNEDCTVDIVANEYDDSFYVISNIARQAGGGLGDNLLADFAPPTLFTATNFVNGTEINGGIMLSWVNNPAAEPGIVSTEIYKAEKPTLYLKVTSISAPGTFNIEFPAQPEGSLEPPITTHGLVVGDAVTSRSGFYGLEEDKIYFVESVPSAFQVTLTDVPGGLPLVFTPGINLELYLMTGNLIATVDVPGITYLDPIVGDEKVRVTRYYWARHKILKD